MAPFVHIGPLSLRTPGLALLAGLWLGMLLSEKAAARKSINPNVIYNLLFLALITAVVAARLAYVIQHLSAYQSSPPSLIALDINTLSLTPGIFAGSIAGAIYIWHKHLPFRVILDVLAPCIAMVLLALGAAHVLSGDAYGAPAKLPWSVYWLGEYRHPSQVYEIIAASLVLLVTWKHPFEGQGQGLNFLLVVGLSAGTRLFLEAFRGDSQLIAGGIRAAQAASLIVLAIVFGLFDKWRETKQEEKVE